MRTPQSLSNDLLERGFGNVEDVGTEVSTLNGHWTFAKTIKSKCKVNTFISFFSNIFIFLPFKMMHSQASDAYLCCLSKACHIGRLLCDFELAQSRFRQNYRVLIWFRCSISDSADFGEKTSEV